VIKLKTICKENENESKSESEGGSSDDEGRCETAGVGHHNTNNDEEFYRKSDDAHIR